jgi:hypothetical protein
VVAEWVLVDWVMGMLIVDMLDGGARKVCVDSLSVQGDGR